MIQPLLRSFALEEIPNQSSVGAQQIFISPTIPNSPSFEISNRPPPAPLPRRGEGGRKLCLFAFHGVLMVNDEFLRIEECPEEAAQAGGRRGGVVDEFRGPLELARFRRSAQGSQICLANQLGPVEIRGVLRFRLAVLC